MGCQVRIRAYSTRPRILRVERGSLVSNGPASNKKLSEAITKTLPFLRRYARAVTGSQQRGDEWVRLCAEVAVRQPELIEGAEDTKLGVFALFHRLQQPFGGLEQGERSRQRQRPAEGIADRDGAVAAPGAAAHRARGLHRRRRRAHPRHRRRQGRAQPAGGAPRTAARRLGARAGDRGRGGDRARRRRHRAQCRPRGGRHRRDREGGGRPRQEAFAAPRAGRHPAARLRQRHLRRQARSCRR